MSAGASAPLRRSLRWTQLGRNVALLALSGVAFALPLSPLLLIGPALAALALLLSPLVARASLASLSVRAGGQRTVVAGQAFEFELELAQGAAPVRLRDAVVVPGSVRGARSRPIGFVASLPRDGTARVPCSWRLVRRGRERRISLALSTAQPLGLVEARAEFELGVDWLALPRLGTVRGVDEHLARSRRRAGARPSRGDEEFYALREGREGDSLHLVHWRSTARRSKLVVRELRAEERPPVEITLVAAVGAAPPGAGAHPGFERAVSVAATFAEHFVRARTPLRFHFAGSPSWSLEVRPRPRSWLALLARLAEVQPETAERPSWPARGGIVVGWRLRPDEARGERGAWIVDVDRAELDQVYSPARRSDPIGEPA
jgi:uncharacterized protein (DUF58 family)